MARRKPPAPIREAAIRTMGRGGRNGRSDPIRTVSIKDRKMPMVADEKRRVDMGQPPQGCGRGVRQWDASNGCRVESEGTSTDLVRVNGRPSRHRRVLDRSTGRGRPGPARRTRPRGIVRTERRPRRGRRRPPAQPSRSCRCRPGGTAPAQLRRSAANASVRPFPTALA